VDLNQTEAELCCETDVLQDRMDRFRDRCTRGRTARSPAFKALQQHIDSLTNLVRCEQIRLMQSGQAHRPPPYMPHLLSLPPEKLAYITMAVLCNMGVQPKHEDQGPSITSVAHAIAMRCWEERVFDRCRGREIDVQACLRVRSQDTRNAGRSAELASMVDHGSWQGNFVGLRLGIRLIHLAAYTGLFLLKRVYYGRNPDTDGAYARVVIEVAS